MAILSIEMYYAHHRGASIAAIAERLNYSEEWVSERIEAARLSIEYQVVIREKASA
jgi:DNA-binding Lrp family transcriptional regulator